MKYLFLGLTAALALPAFAQPFQTDFQLEKRGNQICRTQSNVMEQCLPTVQSQDAFGKQPDGYELVQQLIKWREVQTKDGDKAAIKPAEVGGAFLVDRANADKVIKTFSRLSLRNLAISAGAAGKQVPFFASIFWKAEAWPYVNGTVHIEGYLNFADEVNFNLNDVEDVRKQLEKVIQVTGLADSKTEQNISALRFLERAGRVVTFRVIGTEGQTTDERTITLIKQVAGPMIFGQIVLAPAAEQMADGFAKALAEAIGNAFQKGLADTIQNNLK